MNKKYKVKMENDNYKTSWLKVTHNGYQWQTIRIDDAAQEVPLLIQALQKFVAEQKIGAELTGPIIISTEGGPCSKCGKRVGPGEWHKCPASNTTSGMVPPK